MPADHTIVAVESGPREWATQHGSKNAAFRCKLRKPDGTELGNVEVNYKVQADGSHKTPQPGDTVTGDIEDGPEVKYGPKFKKAQVGGGFGGGGGGGGSRWTPEREASVIRQHSQHMAVLALNGMHPSGPPLVTDPTDDSEGAADWRRMVRRLTDFFDADVQTAVEKAKASS